MKKSITLVMITMLFVILGCSLDKLTGKKDDTPPPVADTNTTNDKPAEADKSPTDSTSSSSADLSMDKFNKIELDMSYDDVKGIMGSDGNETSSTKSGSYESKSYEWKGDKFARVSVRFQNGKLVSKTQSGISERQGTAELSQDKYNKVNIGMSYSDVKGILGSEGELTSITKIANTTISSYTWMGPKYQRVFGSFKDDKLTNKTQSGLN